VSANLSFVHLIANASTLVQLIMLLLLIASVISWAVIFRKWRELQDARVAMNNFESTFWAGTDLAELHRRLNAAGEVLRGAAGIFDAGITSYLRLAKKEGVSHGERIDATRRAMRVTLNRETDLLENHLPYLATVGSISPFVGLFGTVWGIMNSFSALGNVSQATLGMVAPGIAEALVATAMGLFAAIPAVIAYNRYVTDVEKLVNRYDNFLEEFSAVLHRQSLAPQAA